MCVLRILNLRIDGFGCHDLPIVELDKPVPSETGRGTDAKAGMVIAADASVHAQNCELPEV